MENLGKNTENETSNPLNVNGTAGNQVPGQKLSSTNTVNNVPGDQANSKSASVNGPDDNTGKTANESNDNASTSTGISGSDSGKTDKPGGKTKKRLKRVAALRQKQKELDAQIAALIEKKNNLRPEVRKGRNTIRTKYGMQIYAAVYVILGLKEIEKDCKDEYDFERLKIEIEERLKELLGLEKGTKNGIEIEAKIPAFDDMAKICGLEEDLLSCTTIEDFRKLYKSMRDKIKSALKN